MLKKWLGIAFLLMLTSSCGFHLRGIQDMPHWLTEVALITQGNSVELRPLVRAQLEAYSIHIIDDPKQAKYWLVLTGTQYTQQIISIGASTNPRQSHLVYKLHYYLQERQGKVIIPASTIAVSRQLTVNNDRILGSDEEADLILGEMRQDVVLQLMNQIARHGKR